VLTPWRRGEVALTNCRNLRQGDAIFNRVLLVRLPFIICLFIPLFPMAVSHAIFTINSFHVSPEAKGWNRSAPMNSSTQFVPEGGGTADPGGCGGVGFGAFFEQ
jgi:hypothetical protein